MSDGFRLGLIIDEIDIFEKWGIRVKDRKYLKPNKKKILEYLPHSSKTLDFSEIYGGPSYEERSLQYTLNLIGTQPNRIAAEFLDTEFTNFIMAKPQFKLIDELFDGYYFLAEVRTGTDFSPLFSYGELTVVFNAYPFRIKEGKEGSPYWDDYSILDYYQEVEFTVSGTKQIELMNNGSERVYPKVNCSSPMKINKGNTQYNFPTGLSTSLDFSLSIGMNNITVTGNGKIDFEFHKELI